MYLVLTGSEFGIELDPNHPTKFIDTLEEAEKVYQKYYKGHRCAIMYEVTYTGLVPVKYDYNC